MGLFKNFRFTNDMNMQFRAEFFNVFNQVNLDIPGTTPNDNRTSVSGANYNRVDQDGSGRRRSAHHPVRSEVRVLGDS